MLQCNTDTFTLFKWHHMSAMASQIIVDRLIDPLYSRHFWQSTIKHNSIKCIKHAVKRYYVHNKSGNGIYVHNKTRYWGMTYNTYIYAYTHINIISSLMRFEVIKWLALSKYTQKLSTEIEGLHDDNPGVANAPGGVTTPSAVNDDKAASATTLMPVYTVIKPMQQMNM